LRWIPRVLAHGVSPCRTALDTSIGRNRCLVKRRRSSPAILFHRSRPTQSPTRGVGSSKDNS
jgi:hypothetical protein